MKRRSDTLPTVGVKEYRKWIAELKVRYRATQIKAAVVVNSAMLEFYRQLKNEWDEPTIGLLLCRDGNRTVVEYALSVTEKPMGVARYKLTQRPPKGLAEIKKAADKLGGVVDETFMESELSPKHDAARKTEEVSNG